MALTAEEKDKIRIEETLFIQRELINLSDESITILCRNIRELKKQDAYKKKLLSITKVAKKTVKKKRPRIVITKIEAEGYNDIKFEKQLQGLKDFASKILAG